MKKLIIASLVLLLSTGIVTATELRFLGQSKTAGIYDWSDVDPIIGIASFEGKNIDGLAYYAHTPIVKYGNTRINFGVIASTETDDDWVRAEFSVSYLWTDALNLPPWIGLETGVYCVTTYDAWGFQLGLLRLNW